MKDETKHEQPRIILPEEWPTVRDTMKAPPMLVEHIVPAKSRTLLHGPPGVGKSSLLWNIGNAVTEGRPILGLKTTKAPCLLVSVDMNMYELKQRWGTVFVPLFPFITPAKLDICDLDKFSNTRLFHEVREHAAKYGTELMMLDATGGFHLDHTAIDDRTASLFDAALSYWLPDCAVLMLGHNHKRRYVEGKAAEPGPEDCLGSQLWAANATSQLNLVKVAENISQLRHEKSQVLALLPDPIRIYMSKAGQVELYNEHKTASAVASLQNAEQMLAPKLAPLKPTGQVKLLAEHLGISRSRVYELKRLAKEVPENITIKAVNGIPISRAVQKCTQNPLDVQVIEST